MHQLYMPPFRIPRFSCPFLEAARLLVPSMRRVSRVELRVPPSPYLNVPPSRRLIIHRLAEFYTVASKPVAKGSPSIIITIPEVR